MAYKNILVAIDLGPATSAVMQQAYVLASKHEAKLHVIHVIEPISIAYGGDIPMDFSAIQEELKDQACKQMDGLCESICVQKEDRYLVTGRLESEIRAQAKSIDCDLIILGNHARWGLALLLGSTTDGITHNADCDVLLVRVEPEN